MPAKGKATGPSFVSNPPGRRWRLYDVIDRVAAVARGLARTGVSKRVSTPACRKHEQVRGASSIFIGQLMRRFGRSMGFRRCGLHLPGEATYSSFLGRLTQGGRSIDCEKPRAGRRDEAIGARGALERVLSPAMSDAYIS
jgi:hypothetical protein